MWSMFYVHEYAVPSYLIKSALSVMVGGYMLFCYPSSSVVLEQLIYNLKLQLLLDEVFYSFSNSFLLLIL